MEPGPGRPVPVPTEAAVRDSRGRPCPIEVEVFTAGPPEPTGVSRYAFPGAAVLRPGRSAYVVGGDLAPATVVAAYAAGFFPWPERPEAELVWCSPDPRAVLPVATFTVPQRLGRTIRQGRFRVTVDAAFEAVIRSCAERPEGTWIIPALIEGYCALHRLGWAHSFEVWHDGELAGGLYGVAYGAMFGAESMFSRVRDASKVAVAAMVQHCRALGVELIDIQVLNDHTARMGGIEISRDAYLELLGRAARRTVAWHRAGAAEGLAGCG